MNVTGFCRHHDCNKPAMFRIYESYGGLLHSIPHCEDHLEWAEKLLHDYIKQVKEGVKKCESPS